MSFLFGCESHSQVNDRNFTAEKFSRTASFIANENIDVVFPLFGAFEERKWETDWEPILIYPDEEIIEEGTTFKTHGHGSESEYLWIVSKYEPQYYHIQYLVSTNNRHWTITVKCESIEDATKTKTTVTYTYIGLNAKGNQLNKAALAHMYRNDLKDWEAALNKYLASN